MEIQKRLAVRVKALRLAKGWSQEELAHQAGMHRTFVSQIERATKTSSIVTVEKVARAFDITIGELLDE
ncbi:helix-turn-helix domain-containing protein [Brevundimonas diminuta]|jgi:transcriptional regulator with XRE-family HTH domain|uniref:helix-turn-helix domain-containing protein n=1 Tax=Brevundimonas diminuta TaxID=293 RepID=UPI003D9A609A